MEQTKSWGGARPGAGRGHEHEQYLMVEVVDYYGEKDILLAGPVLNANGTASKTVDERAEDIAAHHVEEGAQAVRILKRWCCKLREPEVVRVVKQR